jgi:CheY-like chemotaxis protein
VEQATSQAAQAAAMPAQGAAQGTVLVVDDEMPVRMLISEALTDLGYAVQVAQDGPSAMRTLSSSARLDLLVTDVGMPGGMNGRQLAEMARERRPGLKVLFITGYADGILSGKGMLGTGMEVMTKPFAISDLAEKIRTMVANTAIQNG